MSCSASAKTGPSAACYLKKGWVLDVYGDGMCSVRIDDGAVVDNVRENQLETVLPSCGEHCVLLWGQHEGDVALLLEKKKDLEKVIIQLVEDPDVVMELSMDSVAAYSST